MGNLNKNSGGAALETAPQFFKGIFMANLERTAEYARKFETSPIFRQRNTGTIAANAFFNYDWEVSSPVEAKKYLPFNLLIITNNNTSNPLELYINGDILPIKYVPAGTIVTINRDTIPAFSSITLKNIGTTTIATGELEVVAQREAIKPEEMAQNLHRRINLR